MRKLIVVLMISLLGAINSNSQTADELLDRSAGDVMLGNYDSALVKINRAIQISPNLSRAYKERGFLLFVLKMTAEKLANGEPQSKISDAQRKANQLLDQIGQDSVFQRAYEDLSHAIRLDSSNWEAYNTRAALLEMVVRRKEALADYRNALRLAPQLQETQSNIERLEETLALIEEFDAPCKVREAIVNKWKVGRFKMKGVPVTTAYVERDNKRQIEHLLDKNAKITLGITWVSECEYDLTFQEVDSKELERFLGKSMRVRIIEADKKSLRVVFLIDGLYGLGEYERIDD